MELKKPTSHSLGSRDTEVHGNKGKDNLRSWFCLKFASEITTLLELALAELIPLLPWFKKRQCEQVIVSKWPFECGVWHTQTLEEQGLAKESDHAEKINKIYILGLKSKLRKEHKIVK